ncbi:Coenzyme F420-0:L-glutamate ligase @ F420-1:L-glutamate ligase [hydrothermal vent metagenome]|uniref:Coenzyme F420-0:L-glutamate ligase @ F420-1:L-glutamate ligase n=1 Tax=hydrothermal vent metagenome TaxID=652676 RepID=A0A3B0UID7_9ZZZZ
MTILDLRLTAVPDIPHVQSGDDLAGLILDALQAANISLLDGDILAIAQKIVSKAEGRLVRLTDVQPRERAFEVAAQTEKDPRIVELILQESDEISRLRPGVLIVRHRLGFTSANAGIDRSNVAQSDEDGTVLLLPIDPDRSAAQLREAIQTRLGVNLGVVITDSHGRPFRMGTVGVAIGVAGLPALWDRRGEPDLYGHELQHTDIGVADEIAAAAGLLMGQAAEGMPVVLLRGLRLPVVDGKATDLVRAKEMDLYR